MQQLRCEEAGKHLLQYCIEHQIMHISIGPYVDKIINPTVAQQYVIDFCKNQRIAKFFLSIKTLKPFNYRMEILLDY